jgi:hypothetical protein
MRRFAILVVCVLGLFFAHARPAKAQSPPKAQSPTPAATLTEAQIHTLADRVIAAQHADDEALEEFERIEQHSVYSGSNRHITEDKFYRVVPTGSGTLKLLFKDNYSPLDPASYRKQLHDWEQILEIAVNPDDPREQAVFAKWQKKMKERKDLLEAAQRAYHVASSGKEMRNGRLCDTLTLEPNPSFVPHSTAENVLTGTRAKIWVDDATGQIVHGEAEVIKDISFGGGILGKLYRGGHFSLDATEVAPGIWAPYRVQFDYAVRKFLFTFDTHEVTQNSHYRRIGGPIKALAIAKEELAQGAPLPADP